MTESTDEIRCLNETLGKICGLLIAKEMVSTTILKTGYNPSTMLWITLLCSWEYKRVELQSQQQKNYFIGFIIEFVRHLSSPTLSTSSSSSWWSWNRFISEITICRTSHWQSKIILILSLRFPLPKISGVCWAFIFQFLSRF